MSEVGHISGISVFHQNEKLSSGIDLGSSNDPEVRTIPICANESTKNLYVPTHTLSSHR